MLCAEVWDLLLFKTVCLSSRTTELNFQMQTFKIFVHNLFPHRELFPPTIVRCITRRHQLTHFFSPRNSPPGIFSFYNTPGINTKTFVVERNSNGEVFTRECSLWVTDNLRLVRRIRRFPIDHQIEEYNLDTLFGGKMLKNKEKDSFCL
jgi:hypothetical protein